MTFTTTTSTSASKVPDEQPVPAKPPCLAQHRAMAVAHPKRWRRQHGQGLTGKAGALALRLRTVAIPQPWSLVPGFDGQAALRVQTFTADKIDLLGVRTV